MPSPAAMRFAVLDVMTCLSSGRLAADVGRSRCQRSGLVRRTDGAGVLQAVPDRVRPEGGEQRPDDAAGLQRAEDGGVQLRDAVQEDEDAVALLDAELAQHVRPLVRHPRHVGVGVGLLRAVLALPEDRRLVAIAVRDVAVERLIGDVEAAARQAVQLLRDVLPLEGCALGIVVVEVGAHLELGGRDLLDGLVGHGRTSSRLECGGRRREECSRKEAWFVPNEGWLDLAASGAVQTYSRRGRDLVREFGCRFSGRSAPVA